MVPKRPLLSRAAFCGLLTVGAACTDEMPTATPSRAASVTAGPTLPQPAAAYRTIDDDFADLVDRIPGFGGLFADSTGVLIVHRAGTASAHMTAPAAAQVIADFADRRNMRELAVAARGPIRFRNAAFDFRSLLGWQRMLKQRLGVAGVISYDVDDQRNQIAIGVEDAGAAEAVMRRVAELGVPDGAVVTPVELRAVSAATLDDSTNRVAGLKITRVNMGGSCTLGPLLFTKDGFGAIDSTTLYFVTNSHCTHTPWVLDSGWQGQPDGSHPIGYEIADPPLYTNAQQLDCPVPTHYGWSTKCRSSDAALYQATYSITPAWHGTIYVTPGDNNINISDTWSIATEAYPYVNQYIAKTGARTGTTYGQVRHVCKDYKHESPPYEDRWMLCQVEAYLYGGRGDSGSPVVANADVSGYSHLHNPRALIGLFWGGLAAPDAQTWTWSLISPWGQVKAELGTNLHPTR